MVKQTWMLKIVVVWHLWPQTCLGENMHNYRIWNIVSFWNSIFCVSVFWELLLAFGAYLGSQYERCFGFLKNVLKNSHAHDLNHKCFDFKKWNHIWYLYLNLKKLMINCFWPFSYSFLGYKCYKPTFQKMWIK